MKVTVLGWYNHGNAGDDAFMKAFPRLLKGHDVVFTETLRADHRTDAFILGGGDVAYPAYTDQLAKFPETRKIAASVSLTSNSDFEALRGFERVFVRDKFSLDLATGQGISASYLPDITFALTPNPTLGREWIKQSFAKQGLRLHPKVIVCVCSAYMAYNYDTALSRDAFNFLKVANDLARALDEAEASIVFLPFSVQRPWDDRMSNSWVGGRCQYWQKVGVVHDTLDVQTTLNVLSAANAVISTRLHSTIWSVLSGIPFIDLTHHSKNVGFIETVGKPEWSIDLWEYNARTFKGMLKQHLEADLPNEELASFTRQAKEQLATTPLF